jgi:hypothetical protein
MATESISSTEWKQLYHSALLETNRAKLSRRVAGAHTAIRNRLQELLSHPSCEEQMALEDATRLLCILEKESLKEHKTG